VDNSPIAVIAWQGSTIQKRSLREQKNRWPTAWLFMSADLAILVAQGTVLFAHGEGLPVGGGDDW